MRLLIADDDADLARLIGYSARILWPDSAIATAPDGATALQFFTAERPDLVILDVMMPPPDGFEVCRQLRQAAPTLPILMLTARDTVMDEVRALDLGADDYLTKPFDHLKLLAHLRALARRAGHLAPAGDAADLTLGELTLDFTTHEAWIRNERLELTPTEYMLLEVLGRNVGQFVPHRTLLERVWGRDYAYDAHYLKVFINRLRQKLGDNAAYPRYIETKRGVGYRLIPAAVRA
jgi:DNA-binding response OmpR family regulator